MIPRIITRRILIGIGLLFVVSALAFVLVSLIPGNAAESILGTSATPQQITQLNTQLGLNRPLWDQYWTWLTQALRGNLGDSILSPQPIAPELNKAALVSIPLAIGATIASMVIGTASGTLAAIRGGSVARALDGFGLIAMALPAFWIAIVLAQVFGVELGWFPATGLVPFSQSPADWLHSLVLPAAALCIGGIASVSKQTRDSVDDILRRDFVDVLKVDGISSRRILFHHILRNAAIPVIAVSGTQFIATLGGAVLIEAIFGLPGLGTLAVNATVNHDLPTIVGVAVYFCIAVVVVNLILDVVYALLNPKVRARA